MITEDYVSFETAKLLKEKGFDTVDIDAYFPFVYYADGKMDFYNDDNPLFVCEAVTLQMAMKWLRKKHHLEIYPFHEALQEFNNWWFRIERHSKGCSLDEYESELEYNEYEDACEAAIKYCLENLI